MKQRGRGFTLLELMVATAVFAIVALVIYARLGDALDRAGQLEARTLATWVAENALATARIAPLEEGAGLPLGRRNESARLAGREFRVELEFVATSLPTLRRVEVRVFEGNAAPRDGPTARLIGFVGNQR